MKIHLDKLTNLDIDEHIPRKRGRPPKTPRGPGNVAYASPSQRSKQVTAQVQTPQISHRPLPQQTPGSSQSSPPARTTPTRPIIKALPTVRDHTSDQLGENGDEYLPKEFDENGEKKVDGMGNLQDGRTYKCRTFTVPHRGKKLFMLATECARVLGYRDSYLLFNKNRSLYKIIATQIEKDDLIQQDILPYSYRSRQIAIVTARSMFRQFGSRVIVNGRRVRDDYWEGKARKQGFTEDDLAGEKRPGAAKARDAAAAEAASAGIMPTLGHGDVIYSHNSNLDGLSQGLPPGMATLPASLSPLPMIHLAPADDPRLREFNSISRPRQEVTGQPYQDRSQPSNGSEIMNQASHTVDFSKILNQQRNYRSKGLEDQWNKPHEIPSSSPQPAQQSAPGQVDTTSTINQSLQSPRLTAGQQQNVMTQPPTMMTPQQGFAQPSHQQTPVGHSPLRGMPQGMRPEHLQHRSSMSMSSAGSSQPSPYPYAHNTQAWGQPPPQPQPQPSPLSSAQSINMPQYPPQMHPQQTPSPRLHSAPSTHPSQSPRHQHRPQPTQQLHAQPQTHQNLAATAYPGVTTTGYPNMAAARAMYPSMQSAQQQFMPAPQQQAMPVGLGMATSAGLPGWPSTAGGPLQPGQSPAQQGNWPTTY